MKSHQRAVKSWLVDVGATNVRIIHGGKHNRLSFTYNNQTYTHPIACTPRDPHAAIDNSIHQLRRRIKP